MPSSQSESLKPAVGPLPPIRKSARRLRGACLSLGILYFASGCEVNVNENKDASNQPATETAQPAAAPETTSTATPATAPVAPTPAPTPSGADQLDISGAAMLGPHADMAAQDAAVTRALHSANKEGDNVRMSFDALGWPSEGGSKKIDGGVYIFWQVGGGQVVGGLFDWHGVGQTVKTLANIHGGYLDGQKPPGGAAIWFCIVSLDGRQRTNVVKSNTAW